MEKRQSNSLNIYRLSFTQRKSIYRRSSAIKNIEQEKNNNNFNILSSFQKLINANREEKLIKLNLDINNNFNRNEDNDKNKKRIHSLGLLKNKHYSISLTNHFKTERRNAIQRKIGLNIEIPDDIEVIDSLCLNPHQRNIEDLHKIAFFISGSSLINGLLNTQKKQKDLEKLIYEMSFRIKHKYVPSNTILFRLGDIPDNFYIIIQGEVEILKPQKYLEKMNGFEYFKILIKYQNEEEFYLLNEIIELNYHLFGIYKHDIPIIKYFLLKHELDEYFQSTATIKGDDIIKIIKEYYCEDILDKIQLNKNITINAINPNNRYKINRFKEDIYKNFPKNTSSKTKIYMKFIDKTNIKEINILRYSKIVVLKDKDYFGDNAFDTKSQRNATVRTSEDTHLCYLNKEQYELFLKPEKKSQRLSWIHFLLDNFFFKELSISNFESNFFSRFIYEEKTQNEFLFKQFTSSDYLYFLKSGEIELSNQSSIIQIYFLTKNIYQLNMKINQYINKIENSEPRHLAPGFKNNIFFLKKDLQSKKNFFLFNVLNKDVIGLESIAFDIPYLYNAKVISKSAFLFKIEKKILYELIKNNDGVKDCMIIDGKKKIEIILDRFVENNKTQIKKIDDNLSNNILYNNKKDDEKIKNFKINEAIKSIIKNKIEKNNNNKKSNGLELSDNNKCYSEERTMSIDIFGRKYSLLNLKKNDSYKTIIRVSNNTNIMKKDNKLKKKIKINKELFSHTINKYEGNKTSKKLFFTQPKNKNSQKKLNIANDETNNSKIKIITTEIDYKNNLLFKFDNNIISLNILNKKAKHFNRNKNNFKNYNFPHLYQTVVNVEKIKRLKLHLKHRNASQTCIKKNIKIININKKSCSSDRKSNIYK